VQENIHPILLRPLKGKEENSEFPIAPMNAFRRGIKRLQKEPPGQMEKKNHPVRGLSMWITAQA
jgi:hypothetical protein